MRTVEGTTVPAATRRAGTPARPTRPCAENLRRAIAGVAPREEADDEDSQDGPIRPEPADRDREPGTG